MYNRFKGKFFLGITILILALTICVNTSYGAENEAKQVRPGARNDAEIINYDLATVSDASLCEVKSGWYYEDDNSLVYYNASGNVVRVYKPDENKSYDMVDGQLVLNTEKIILLGIDVSNPRSYYADAEGNIVQSEGWIQATAFTRLYINESGWVAYKLYKFSGCWHYYTYSFATNSWVQAIDCAKNVAGLMYSIDDQGDITHLYNVSLRKYYEWQTNKWVVIKDSVEELKGFSNRWYYFDEDGYLNNTRGYMLLSDGRLIYNCAAGYISLCLTPIDDTWTYYSYNADTKQMEMALRSWKNINGNIYYFGYDGKANRVYYGDTKKVYNFISGSWSMVKNTVALLGAPGQVTRYYYFNANGNIYAYKSQWYQVSSTLRVYFDDNGHITRSSQFRDGIWKRAEFDTEISAWVISSNELGQAIADEAVKYVGGAYVAGGKDLATGVDCSGFTQAIFKLFDITLPGSSAAQSEYGTTIPLDLNEMEPGDLIFYASGTTYYHVAIYIGDGNVVHALNSNKGIVITTYDYCVNPALVKRLTE